MKHVFLPLATLGLALAAQGQPTVSQNATGASPPYSVASPNRTRAAELVSAAPRDGHHRHRRDDQDALVWVDATGKTVGRFASDTTMVVSYHHQTALLGGLTSVSCTTPAPCSPLDGARWNAVPTDFLVYYPTPDCSGQSYLTFSTPATPYVGVPVMDGGSTYIYFSRVTDAAIVLLKSNFANNQCRALLRQFESFAAPTLAVIPASVIGTEPFTVK